MIKGLLGRFLQWALLKKGRRIVGVILVWIFFKLRIVEVSFEKR